VISLQKPETTKQLPLKITTESLVHFTNSDSNSTEIHADSHSVFVQQPGAFSGVTLSYAGPQR